MKMIFLCIMKLAKNLVDELKQIEIRNTYVVCMCINFMLVCNSMLFCIFALFDFANFIFMYDFIFVCYINCIFTLYPPACIFFVLHITNTIKRTIQIQIQYNKVLHNTYIYAYTSLYILYIVFICYKVYMWACVVLFHNLA